MFRISYLLAKIINLLYNIEFYYFFNVKAENSYFGGIRSPIFDVRTFIWREEKVSLFCILAEYFTELGNEDDRGSCSLSVYFIFIALINVSQTK